MNTLCLKTGLLCLLLATTAQGAEPVTQSTEGSGPENVRAPLSAAHIHSIRAIGRGILAAKKTGTEDATDAEQVERLRVALARLIAADFDPQARGPISVQGHESNAQRSARKAAADLRAAVRADAHTLASRLHAHSRRKAAYARSATDDTRSGGLRIGAQRARLFERWADQLDAALAEGTKDRMGQLLALRAQVRSTHGGLTSAPLSRGTPTLQAMPAGYASSDHNSPANAE